VKREIPRGGPHADTSPPPPERPLRLGPADQVVPLRLSTPAARRPPPGPEAAVAPPATPRAGGGAEVRWTGEALRRTREALGLSLAGLAERTKVAAEQLEAVEAGRRDRLPPPAYLRGILASVAQVLGLDAAQVSRSYLGALEDDRVR
jgi:hypothetical protein